MLQAGLIPTRLGRALALLPFACGALAARRPRSYPARQLMDAPIRPNSSHSSEPPAGPSPPQPPPERPISWKAWLSLFLLLGAMGLWRAYEEEPPHPEIAYSQVYAWVERGQVETVSLRGDRATGTLKSPVELPGQSVRTFRTRRPVGDTDFVKVLRGNGVVIRVRSEEQPFGLLAALVPWILVIGVWVWLSRRAQKMMMGGGPLGGVLKGRTRRFDKEKSVSVSFKDVAGLKSAKRDLQEVVAFLKEPDKFRRLGGKVPRGALLVGPPGTGKTLLARAVAGEAGVPFFSISASEFIEMFVGVGASRVRDLFSEARKVAPSIVFIDEIDAVGRSRGAGLGGGNDEREQTLNQLLSEMDGFDRNDLTIVLAATNRPDVLDPALLRPGRFDRRVLVDRPELDARRAILQVHVREKPLAEDVDLDQAARDTPGFSGADLANLANEAALSATRRGAETIAQSDFEEAFEKIVLGDPRESKLDPEEKHRVAVHESGHAVAAHFNPDSEPPRRVSILPRGMALGVTQQTPTADRHIQTQPELEAQLQVLMGGYAAERTVLGNVSSGAANDLQRATQIAFKMVAQFGMSDRVGPVYHEHKVEHAFLGQRLATESGTSDETVHQLEDEVRRLLREAEQGAEGLITKHRTLLQSLVSALLDTETLEADQLLSILGKPTGPSGRTVPSKLPA